MVSNPLGRVKKAFINQYVTTGFDNLIGLLYNVVIELRNALTGESTGTLRG